MHDLKYFSIFSVRSEDDVGFQVINVGTLLPLTYEASDRWIFDEEMRLADARLAWKTITRPNAKADGVNISNQSKTGNGSSRQIFMARWI